MEEAKARLAVPCAGTLTTTSWPITTPKDRTIQPPKRTINQAASTSSRWCGDLLDFGGSFLGQLLVSQVRTSSLHINVMWETYIPVCYDIDLIPTSNPKGPRVSCRRAAGLRHGPAFTSSRSQGLSLAIKASMTCTVMLAWAAVESPEDPLKLTS